MKTRLLHIGLFLFTLCQFSFAAGPGDNAPAMSVTRWISGHPVALPTPGQGVDRGKKERDYYAVMIWGSWAPASPGAMKTLQMMSRQYPNLYIAAITRDNEQTARDFAMKYAVSGLNIGLDNNSKTTKNFMKNSILVPRVFLINDERKIIWVGEPMDFPEVFKQVRTGKFNEDNAREIYEITVKLITALQSANTRGIIIYSNKILELDPANAFAIRTRLFTFERSNDTSEAVKFIAGLTQKAPKNPTLYFTQMELMLNTNAAPKDYHAVYQAIMKNFSSDSTVMLDFVRFMLNRVPFACMAPKILQQAAKNAETSMPKDIQARDKAGYLTAIARVNALSGNFTAAVKYQQQAVSLLKGDDKKQAENILRVIKQLHTPTGK